MANDKKPNETFEQYKERRAMNNAFDKMLRKGWRPTVFVQHYNPSKNPLPRGMFVK